MSVAAENYAGDYQPEPEICEVCLNPYSDSIPCGCPMDNERKGLTTCETSVTAK